VEPVRSVADERWWSVSFSVVRNEERLWCLTLAGWNQSRVMNVERKYLWGWIASALSFAMPDSLTGTRGIYSVGVVPQGPGLPKDPHRHPNSGVMPNATSRDEPGDVGRNVTVHLALPLLNLAFVLPKFPPFPKLLPWTWDKKHAFPQPVVVEELAGSSSLNRSFSTNPDSVTPPTIHLRSNIGSRLLLTVWVRYSRTRRWEGSSGFPWVVFREWSVAYM